MHRPVLITAATLILTFLLQLEARSEKHPLHHGVYDQWKNISGQRLSADGRWVSFEINPQKGDGHLFIKSLQTGRVDSVARGTGAVFSPGSEYLAFMVRPGEEEETNGNEKKGSTLYIKTLHDQSIFTVENVRKFSLANELSSWIVYQMEKSPGDTIEGSDLVAYDPVSGVEHRFERITDYSLSDNGRLLLMAGPADENDDHTYRVLSTLHGNSEVIYSGEGKPGNMLASPCGSKAAFIFEEAEKRAYSLFFWESGDPAASQAVTAGSQGMPEGWNVNKNTSLSFNADGNRLFFGTAPIKEDEPEDRDADKERHSLDVWHYRDPLIQPMQLVRKEDELKRTYAAIYHPAEGRMVQLACEEVPEVSTGQPGEGLLEMGLSELPYLIPNSFESGNYRDVYIVDVLTGEKELVLERHRGSVHRSTAGDPRISPGGNYLLYYSQKERDWFAMDLGDDKRQKVNISKHLPVSLYDEIHDAPGEPDPYGVAAWTEGDRYVLVYDRYDIWKLDPARKDEAVCLTGSYGRENNIRFRYVDLDPDSDHIGNRERIMLSAFNKNNKQSGFYNIRIDRPGTPESLVMEDARYFRPVKAADAQVLMWQKSTFIDFPDLHISDMFFNNPRRISDANPQQDNYLWGSVELVEWVSFANDTLQGLLYKPEDLDPENKYPMIVYFYERSSDGLHLHQVPSPSRSTINRTYCTSNGYIVFVPDIKYRVGYPGQSAYDAIVSGTKAIIGRYDFIDRNNVGLQGQSWAGYQIAWLITRTDMFKAAMAGAPVSNMVSAYGGIRWSTGMSRIYQYEETQSRIGGTLWEKTMLYIENSPVFHADRVNTPLLMMHNDADGAVPWYQGIEYFMALRRLDKPVWMLNYNGEAHNLTQRPNMMDLSIRMYQFFDHYLKDKPAPVWMEEGIPAIRKGIDDGYELVE